MSERIVTHDRLVGVASRLLPPATYESVREIYHHMRHAHERANSVYARLVDLSTGRMELLSLMSAVTRLFLSLARTSESGRKDVTLRLGGGVYVVDLSLMEAETLAELYVDRHHDRIDRFIPQEGWNVVDIGANVGMYAVMQSKRGAKVYAFEANPECYGRLLKTVRANRLRTRVAAWNQAIGGAPGWGVVTAPYGGRGTPAGFVTALEGPSEDTNAVSVKPLDSIEELRGIERIHLLKVDVEGAEVEVLRGARLILTRVERIVIEYHSPTLDEQVTQLLTGSGFSTVTRVDVLPEQHVGLIYAERSVGERTTLNQSQSDVGPEGAQQPA